jgi:hypothetical protein
LTATQPGSHGIGAQLISQQCEPNANVNAVFFRAALLQYLFQSELLDDWRDGDEPIQTVFQVAAVFPMDQGVQGFDPTGFVERLRSAEP